MIFRLKQQISTQQQKIDELLFENEELKEQLLQAPIKDEGTCTYTSHNCTSVH